MKEIRVFHSKKYDNGNYLCIDDSIYFCKDCYYVSLSFFQEPELGEGTGTNLSQYPIEDILDKYLVYISDFYNDLNNNLEGRCFLEFPSDDIGDIKALLNIVGKNVFVKNVANNRSALIIE